LELRFGASVFHGPKDVSHMMAPSALKLPNKSERAVETDAGRGDAAAAEATALQEIMRMQTVSLKRYARYIN
jgi:hypothetical protein